jgi:hypothetical protein
VLDRSGVIWLIEAGLANLVGLTIALVVLTVVLAVLALPPFLAAVK